MLPMTGTEGPAATATSRQRRILAGCSLAAVIVGAGLCWGLRACSESSRGPRVPPPPAAVKVAATAPIDAAPVDGGDSLAQRLERFVGDWVTAQHRGDLETYRMFYHSEFSGHHGWNEPWLRRDAWLAEAEHDLPCITHWELTRGLPEPEVQPGARLRFDVHYRARRRCGPGWQSESGTRELTVVASDIGFQVVREVVEFRGPGWLDDSELRRLSPRNARSCAPAPFAPGRAGHLAIVRGGDDYVQALAEVAKWRRKGVPAQLVSSRDVAALAAGSDGYWLVLDADDDAGRLRARLPRGARAISGRLADGLPTTNLRLLGWYASAETLPAPSATAKVGVARAGSYFGDEWHLYFLPRPGATGTSPGEVDAGAEATTAPAGCRTVQGATPPHAQSRLAVLEVDLERLAGATITRLASQDDGAFLADSRDRWFRLDGCLLQPVPAIEPEPADPKTAAVNGWRYRLEPGRAETRASLLAERSGKPGFRMPLYQGGGQPWAIHAGAGQLVLVQKGRLWLFAASSNLLPPRLVRVCGRYNSPDPRPGRRTGQVTFAGLVATTDHTGGFDLWTSGWGNLEVEYRPALPGLDDGCAKHEQGFPLADELPLFGDQEQTVGYGLYCQENGD
jgi:hypothetical protein